MLFRSPEANDDTRDKMMFFATQEFSGIWPEKKIVEAQIAYELPKYLRWRMQQKNPPHVTEGAFKRMGVVSYFDPHVLQLSQQQTYFYTFAELLPVWVHNALTFPDPTWIGNPTKLAAEMHLVEPIAPMMKDWTVEKIAKALTAIARVGGLGVELIPNSEGRLFKLTKAVLALASEAVNEPHNQQMATGAIPTAPN